MVEANYVVTLFVVTGQNVIFITNRVTTELSQNVVIIRRLGCNWHQKPIEVTQMTTILAKFAWGKGPYCNNYYIKQRYYKLGCNNARLIIDIPFDISCTEGVFFAERLLTFDS